MRRQVNRLVVAAAFTTVLVVVGGAGARSFVLLIPKLVAVVVIVEVYRLISLPHGTGGNVAVVASGNSSTEDLLDQHDNDARPHR